VRGSVDYQITRIFNESGIFRPGTSRHKEKDSARAALAALGMAASSEALADVVGLHSYAYARDCKDTWHRLGHFAKESLGVRDMSRLSGSHAEQYLLRRMREGISYGSWKKEAAHIGKLENALRELSNKADPDFSTVSPGIRMAALDPELRTQAREQLSRSDKDFGHFADPEAVIACLETDSRPECVLVARIQLEGGARCREACRITEEQFYGLKRDPFTDRIRGQIHLTDTKGGKPRTIQVSAELYAELEAAAGKRNHVLHVSMSSYAKAVHAAAGKAGETLGGTHAFRYCFARRRYRELTLPVSHGAGFTHEAATQQVSWEMGHERAGITALYLR
jgi:integrase